MIKNSYFLWSISVALSLIAAKSVLATLPASAALTPPQPAIASASPRATAAGLKILTEKNGNAFDAAIAVAAVLAVDEPYNSGLGGGGFWLIYRVRDHHYQFIDSREVAPLAATSTLFLDHKGHPIKDASLNGPLAAAIPGEVAGWTYLAKHEGRLPLAVSLQPAIELAQQGIVVDKDYQRAATRRLAALNADSTAAHQFLLNGAIPPLGYRIKQPALAHTLQLIAAEGQKGFYQGSTAKKLVTAVRQAGGIWQLEDLNRYKVIIRKPLIGYYKNATIITAPLPSAGGIGLLTMLNILSAYDLSTTDKVQRVHWIVEAMRRAYYDRNHYLGDPAFVTVPVQQLLSQQHAAKWRETMFPLKATPSTILGKGSLHEGNNTTHFSILDQQGNRVAATLSLNNSFGSGFMPAETGVILNNEMDDFTTNMSTPNSYNLSPNLQNLIQPGKRPLSSMSPTMVETPDKIAILGTPGGSRIISMVLLSILDMMQDHLPISWVSLPRYHHQFEPDEIVYEEKALTSQQKKALQQRGYSLKRSDDVYGNMQAILWDKKRNKVLTASDPRGHGQTELPRQ